MFKVCKNIKPSYKLPFEEIKKIQNIEFDILKVFVLVCDKLHLTYYLHGGTLLGACLYKGFIPWDDDIDVSMPREDYEIFLKQGQDLLPEHLRIQTCYNDKEYTLCFAKIRNINTMLIEYSLQNRKKMMNGVYIDIFPIDALKSKKKNWYVKSLRRRIDMSYLDVEYCPLWKKIAILIMIFPFLFISSNKATQLLDKYRQKKNKKYSSCPSMYIVNRWYYPIEYYFGKKSEEVFFQDLICKSVVNPENWLLIDYPNWKMVPDKNKQIPGHNLVMHNF